MSIEVLKKACRDAIENGREAIVLVMPRGGTRLCGRRGPVGELLCENSIGGNVVRFNAAAVLRFIGKTEQETT